MLSSGRRCSWPTTRIRRRVGSKAARCAVGTTARRARRGAKLLLLPAVAARRRLIGVVYLMRLASTSSSRSTPSSCTSRPTPAAYPDSELAVASVEMDRAPPLLPRAPDRLARRVRRRGGDVMLTACCLAVQRIEALRLLFFLLPVDLIHTTCFAVLHSGRAIEPRTSTSASTRRRATSASAATLKLGAAPPPTRPRVVGGDAAEGPRRRARGVRRVLARRARVRDRRRRALRPRTTSRTSAAPTSARARAATAQRGRRS